MELVAKLSASCERGVTSLSIELLASCLAGDLGLPVEEPLLDSEIDGEWLNSVADEQWQSAADASSPVAFGCRRAPNGFGQWITGTSLTEALVLTAAGVLMFDCITDKYRPASYNPNCLQKGEEIRIIDHELCFPPYLIGWKPPWELGSLNHIAASGVHIFRERKTAI